MPTNADPDDWADPRLTALYDTIEGDRSDLDHYEAIIDELGARSVIDVGCGTGVLARRLVARGLEVIGVDPSSAMLGVAERQPGADSVRWIRGTATDLPSTTSADAAVMTGNVAQVFIEDDDWADTLVAIASALVPGGHLVFETRVPARRAWEGWTPDRTRQRVVHPETGGEVELWCDVLDVAEPLVTFRYTYRFADGSTASATSTLRFRERSEIEISLEAAGFDPIEFRDAPDRPGREWVVIARRR